MSVLGLGIVNVGIAAPMSGGSAPVVNAFPPIDFPNPPAARLPIEVRTWIQSTPLNLIGQDQFYGLGGPTYDYPNPRGYVQPIDLKTWVWSTPLNLSGQDKFYGVGGPSYDYPNPRGYTFSIELRSWFVASRALQTFTPSPYGGGYQNFDWPNPRAPLRSIDLLTWLSPTPIAPLTFPGVPALAFSVDKPVYTATASDSPSGQGWKGPGYMAKYEIGTSIDLFGSFINSLAGVYIDPTGVTLFVIDPNGLKTTFSYTGNPSSPIVKDSQGHYHYTLAPAVSGTWTYKWQATGTAVATSPDTTFVVNASALIAG